MSEDEVRDDYSYDIPGDGREDPPGGEFGSSITYYEEDGTCRTEFDVRSTEVSDAVIATVARAADRDPMSLPRLYTTVDPDALDRIFAPLQTGSGRSAGSVTFEYAEHVVTVSGQGTIEVEPPE